MIPNHHQVKINLSLPVKILELDIIPFLENDLICLLKIFLSRKLLWGILY